MKKQIISLAILAVMTALMLIMPAAADNYGTMYVYTDNGGSLNVRSSPEAGKNIVGTLKYGQEVTVVKMYNNGWAQIQWGKNQSGVAYVQRRFLVNRKPSSKPASSGSSSSSGSTAAATDYAKVFAAMNAEFKTGKRVAAPFTVYSRPSRASGWVNLRWAPSTEAERIATCPQGKALTVIGETRNWYQVEDPQTGMIGFISRQYVSAQ